MAIELGVDRTVESNLMTPEPTHGGPLDCGHPPTPQPPGSCSTGYGTKRDGTRHCFECCAAADRATIERGESILLYYDFPAEDQHATGLNLERRYRRTFHPRLQSEGVMGRENVANVSNWPGHVMGEIIAASVYSHNFGGRFVSLRVRMFNGAIYHGRASWDNGTCINLKPTTKRRR
jgi:hypothetical protein